MDRFTEDNQEKSFERDFRQEYDNPQFSDVVNVCEKKEVRVHSFVLKLRSTVFAPNFAEGLLLIMK